MHFKPTKGKHDDLKTALRKNHVLVSVVQKQHWPHHLWLNKCIMIMMKADSATPKDNVTLSTETRSKNRVTLWMKTSLENITLPHRFSLNHIIPTVGVDLKVDFWPIQASTICADHHKSFIHKLTLQVFQDDPPFLSVSSHNCGKS